MCFNKNIYTGEEVGKIEEAIEDSKKIESTNRGEEPIEVSVAITKTSSELTVVVTFKYVTSSLNGSWTSLL
jgi:hypothetical protein